MMWLSSEQKLQLSFAALGSSFYLNHTKSLSVKIPKGRRVWGGLGSPLHDFMFVYHTQTQQHKFWWNIQRKRYFSMSQLNSVLQLMAVRYFCTKPFSMAKAGVRSLKWTCRLLLELVANLGPSWCLYVTTRGWHTWRILPFLMGSEAREYTGINAP